MSGADRPGSAAGTTASGWRAWWPLAETAALLAALLGVSGLLYLLLGVLCCAR